VVYLKDECVNGLRTQAQVYWRMALIASGRQSLNVGGPWLSDTMHREPIVT